MMWKNKWRKDKYIGDINFYRYVIGIALPMILQNLVTNFVSMLDNIMVGQVGTAQMSGVSIANQYYFIFNLTVFGAISGASIFGTQYFGKGDAKGQQYTFRFRLLTVLLLIMLYGILFLGFGENLIGLFLSKDSSADMVRDTLYYGTTYLKIMSWSLFPFAIGQAYSSVVRECGETKIPMYGSIAAIGVNVILDYCLIFGKCGLPQLGVVGAAIATVIAKYVEAGVVVIWAHTHQDNNPYMQGLYRSIYMPGSLMRDIVIKGMPLLVNEFLWSLSISVVAQCYSVRGLDVVAARNIASTITNLFSVVYIQLGSTIGIIVGARLGAGDFKAAREYATRLNFFSIMVTTVLALIMLPVAYYFPEIYQTEESVKTLATYFIIIQAIALPVLSYTNACYFTLRSGGKTGITFLFDFVFSWLVMIPVAFLLTRFTNLSIYILMPVVTYTEFIKAVMGHYMMKSDLWIQNIVQ